MLKNLKKNRVLIGFLILTISISIAFANQSRLTQQINVKDNTTRCEAVKLIKQLTDNQFRSASATLKSKIASQASKDAASKNLQDLNKVYDTTKKVFNFPHGPDCS